MMDLDGMEKSLAFLDDWNIVRVRKSQVLELISLARIGLAAVERREFLKSDPKFDHIVELIDAKQRKEGE